MSTGFFVQPPRLANFGHSLQEFDQFLTTAEPHEQYKERQFCGLSYCFLNTQKSNGTALVDTAAQHGLVGIQTLQDHDHLLRNSFGLQVQWSQESGGTVRGVCGAEETTKIAYVPIGLGGKSGVLRVQVVPGDIPFLLPAYFLSDLGAVIDMKHATIMYMNLGIKQTMKRLHTGHVSVSIVEFGSGFRVPATFAGAKSQAWSTETVPDWQAAPRAHAQLSAAMGPVAALVAAALQLHFPAGLADYDGSGSHTTAAMCAATSSQKGTLGERSAPADAGRAACDGPSISLELYGSPGRIEHLSAGRAAETTWYDHGQGQVPGSSAGSVTSLQAFPDITWSQSSGELAKVSGLQPRTKDSSDSNCRAQQVEQHHGDDVEMVMEELTHSAHNQSCDYCHHGTVTLCRHVGTDNLFWKCDHQACPLNYAEINQNMVEEAKGVFLCPECSGKEMVPINTTADPQETELQCINFVCNQRALMFELPLMYSRMGRFNIMALQY